MHFEKEGISKPSDASDTEQREECHSFSYTKRFDIRPTGRK